MTEFEDELRAVLHRAAGRLDATAPPWSVVATHAGIGDPCRGRARRWWPRPRLGSLTATFAVAVAIVVAVVALTTLHGSGGGVQSGGSPPVVTPPRSPLAGVSAREQREMYRYFVPAQNRVDRQTHTCWPRGILRERRRPTDARPPAEVLSAFAVLRGQETAKDRAGVDLLPKSLYRRWGPYVRYIRFLGRAAGSAYYLLPIEGPSDHTTPLRCDQETLRIMAGELTRVKASKRRALLRLAQRVLAYDRRDAYRGGLVCLIGGGGLGCTSVEALEERGASVGTGGRGNSRRTTVTAFVPDGPSAITLDIPGGNDTYRHPPRPISITIPVVDNVAVTTLPIAYAELAISPTKILWRAKDGRVIKIFESGAGGSG